MAEETILGGAASAFTNKGAEIAGNRAINAIVDFSKKKFGEAQVSIGTAFTLYLKNARQRYNQVKTIATGTQPRLIIPDGKKPFEKPLYVQIGVSYDGKPYPTGTVEPLLQINKHLLIEGTGGAGKSMLMRYLFLDTSYKEGYVPILLKLNRIKHLNPEHITIPLILKLIYSCMENFNVKLNQEQFEYSLESGKYLFLFDGFDEVPELLMADAAQAIQDFCSKYPDNPCIVASRRRRADTVALETFSTLEIDPLRKGQAVLLASRLRDEDEKTREFCKQLDETLFDDARYRSFAENPLLLTIMFVTFMHNGSIPERQCDFYQSAYDALYSVHDSQDAGIYRRKFRCKTLDKEQFQLLFSHFCFQSYFRGEFEFTEKQLLSYLEKGIKKLGLSDVDPKDYLSDLQNIVCMIVREGKLYRFSHRSFQTYFAAYYVAKELSKSDLKHFIRAFVNKGAPYYDYLDIFYQIAPIAIARHFMVYNVRYILDKADASPDPDFSFLSFYYGCFVEFNNLSSTHISKNVSKFQKINKNFFEKEAGPFKQTVLAYLDKVPALVAEFHEIRTSPLTDEERGARYREFIEREKIPQLRAAIRQWLAEQDAKRAALESSSNLGDLLETL